MAALLLSGNPGGHQRVLRHRKRTVLNVTGVTCFFWMSQCILHLHTEVDTHFPCP